MRTTSTDLDADDRLVATPPTTRIDRVARAYDRARTRAGNIVRRCWNARDRIAHRIDNIDAEAVVERLRPLANHAAPIFAIALLVISMGGTWRIAGAAPPTIAAQLEAETPSEPTRPFKKSAKELTGKLNLNTATEEQLMMLPTVGPAKAERIVTWRKKNGGFKRTADLRRVKGFGYKTYKRLEPFLDVKGETTLK